MDVQPEFWTLSSAISHEFSEFPERCARLLSCCRSRGVLVVFVRCDYRSDRSPWSAQFAALNPDKARDISCAGRLEDLDWEPFAQPQPGEVVLAKRSWNACTQTALLPFLEAVGVQTVLIAGLITSVCVQQSAFGVFEAGYRTVLVADACADRGRARHDAALELYGNYMYELLNVARLETESAWRPEARSLRRPRAAASWVTRKNFRALARELRPRSAASHPTTEVTAATTTPGHVLTNHRHWDVKATVSEPRCRPRALCELDFLSSVPRPSAGV